MLELCRCPNIYGPDCIYIYNKIKYKFCKHFGIGNQTLDGIHSMQSINQKNYETMKVSGYRQLVDF